MQLHGLADAAQAQRAMAVEPVASVRAPLDWATLLLRAPRERPLFRALTVALVALLAAAAVAAVAALRRPAVPGRASGAGSGSG